MKPSELLAAAIKGDTRAAEELGIYLDAMQRIAGESQFNSYVSQINTGVTLSSAKCRGLAATVSVPNSTWTVIPFGTEDWDTAELHSLTINTSRMTSRAAGKYIVVGCVDFPTNANFVRNAALRVNGYDANANSQRSPALAGVNTVLTVSDIVQLAAGDYVELWAWQNSGSTLDLGGLTALAMMQQE